MLVKVLRTRWILILLSLLLIIFCGVVASAQESHQVLLAAQRNNSTQISNTLSSVTSIQEPDFKESNFSGTWNLRLGGRSARDEFSQKTVSTFGLDAQIEYKLMNDLNVIIWPTLNAVSGHAQTDSDFDVNKSALFVRQASADWKIFSGMTLSGGVLYQPTVHSNLLFGEWAFPGFRIAFESDPTYVVQATAFAQSTVPTSQSLSTNTKDFEPTPSFNSIGAGIQYDNTSILLRTRLNYFVYKNLPSNLAFQSGLLGNSVKTSNNLDAQFASDYQGLETVSEAQIHWSKTFGTRFDLVGIRNQAAPAELNQGYSSQISFDFRFNKITLTPSYLYFRMEPDAAVASFVDSRIDTNRVGYRTRLTLQYKNKFRVYIGTGERDVIYQSASQSRERIYDLGLETLDAKF